MSKNKLILVQQTQRMIRWACDRLRGRPRPVNDDAQLAPNTVNPNTVHDELERCFPGSLQHPEALWLKAKSTHPLGSLVRGKVVLCAHFGLFLDIGAGFPVLLLIHRFADADPSREWTEYCPPVGSEIEGRVIVHNDPARQIAITQRPPLAWNQIRECQVDAALAGHDLGSFSWVNDQAVGGWKATCRKCGWPVWVGGDGLMMYNLLGDRCKGGQIDPP